jgi:mannose-6-phosphate isomerase-like protein (cupin superfamily)
MKKEANAERPTPNAQRRIQKGHHARAPAHNRQFSFDLDHKKLAADPRFAEVARELDRQSPIDSSEGFNRYCRTACRIWSEQFGNGIGRTSHQFNELLARVGQGGTDVIPTGWGGVVITLRNDPRIEKFLVVRRGKYLALEKHEQKNEHLEVREGAGLILWRSSANEPLRAELLSPGDQFHFVPGTEHCLIGTEDLLVFERSTDPKGMDQDLVFIYEPE